MEAVVTRRELEEGIQLDPKGSMTYGDYLALPELLGAQRPRSQPPHHDELLFIIQHQTSELWMKLMIHELEAAVALVRNDDLKPSFKVLTRVGHIQHMLFEQWSVLETLTPSEYLEFRGTLGHSSGFQSHQYRAVEFLLGNKDAAMLLPHRHTPEIHDWLERLLRQPSIYDEFLHVLARRGHPVPKEILERDVTQPYVAHPGVVSVLRTIYESPESHWDAYEMSEKLLDVEERFQLWRFRHLKTVQRIIGFRRGTGGSSGVGFLKKALDQTFFPELWDVRTELRAPSDRPRGA